MNRIIKKLFITISISMLFTQGALPGDSSSLSTSTTASNSNLFKIGCAMLVGLSSTVGYLAWRCHTLERISEKRIQDSTLLAGEIKALKQENEKLREDNSGWRADISVYQENLKARYEKYTRLKTEHRELIVERSRTQQNTLHTTVWMCCPNCISRQNNGSQTR